jgi:hypothetical protein
MKCQTRGTTMPRIDIKLKFRDVLYTLHNQATEFSFFFAMPTHALLFWLCFDGTVVKYNNGISVVEGKLNVHLVLHSHYDVG